MGTGLALAVVLALFAFTYWRPLRRVRTALGISHLVSTGHAFLVLGAVLGLALAERRASIVDDLSPFLAFVAGWVGFATGMRFDLRVLRTIPGSVAMVALMPALVAALTVGALGRAVLVFAGTPPAEASAAALVLAASAATSGPTLVALVQARKPGRSSKARPVLRMIEFSAGLDDLVVIALAIAAFALFRTGDETLGSGWLVAVSLGGGAILGAVAWLFSGGQAHEDERLLLGLAMLAFTSGFAGWLYLSPAAVTAICAAVLVNLPGGRAALLLRAVRRVERPAVVILMTVIGTHVTGPMTWVFWPLLVTMTLVRLVSKRVAGQMVAGSVSEARGLSTCKRWGDGLAPQGILGLVVALSLFDVWQDDVARTILGAVAVASVVNEILATWLLVQLLRGIEHGSLGARHSEKSG